MIKRVRASARIEQFGITFCKYTVKVRPQPLGAIVRLFEQKKRAPFEFAPWQLSVPSLLQC